MNIRQPTFDKDGYPSDETIKLIENWDAIPKESRRELWEFFVETFDENYGLLFQVTEEPPENCTRAHRKATAGCDDELETHDVFYVATGGWRNNEAAINALGSNPMFWMVAWLASWRGGAYLFMLPKPEATP